MTRRYDSSRRKKAAEKTREDILRAALKLHWEGVTEYGPLADEAGCSLPTLRKHFPTKEALFQGCTRRFAETLTPPDIEHLQSIREPARRLEACVSEMCRIHEAMFGYAWLSAQRRDESPTLDGEMRGYEGLTDVIAGLIAPAGTPRAGTVRGFLDFLTYRALRLAGGLPSEKAREELLEMLRPWVADDEAPHVRTSERKGPRS